MSTALYNVADQVMEYMAKQDTESMIRSLLDVAGSVDHLLTCNGDTALMIAGARGYVRVAQNLVAAGANINKTNAYGWTALSQSAVKGHFAVRIHDS